MNCVHLGSFRIELYIQSVIEIGVGMDNSTGKSSGDIPRYFQIVVGQYGRKDRQLIRYRI